MKLYTHFRSSASFRVRIALNLKGLAYESAPLVLARGEHREAAYRGVNPQELVPALVDEGRVLNQSLAIIEYLEEKFPRPPLLPADALGRARVRSLALLVACEIHPLNNLRVLGYLRSQLAQDEEGITTWYRYWIAEGLAKLEQELSTEQTGRFAHGDSPTVADCCLVPQIFNARRYDCDTSPYPITMRVFDTCMGLEAFARAQPSKQPDAQ
ncbi:MAG: maleylacetoacetate isomerase [Betaproteobacteria bacterium]|nr:maleylacetoacetate isomerase [Betaproteobacteria bacterium]